MTMTLYLFISFVDKRQTDEGNMHVTIPVAQI